jgi:hypothetical protein
METEDREYGKILNILKKSKPIFADNEAITEKVIRRLQEEKSKVTLPELIFEYMFGWVYIGWVRRLMVTAAVIIAILFGFQQVLILRRINDLSGQRIQNSAFIMTNMTDEWTNKMLIYRITGRKLSDEKITVSEKEIDKMISSFNKLKVKYRDLFKLIEDDPQLKKYFEDKIKEYRKN